MRTSANSAAEFNIISALFIAWDDSTLTIVSTREYVCAQVDVVGFAIWTGRTWPPPDAAAVPTQDKWKKIIVCDISGLACGTLAIYPDETTPVGCERIYTRAHAAHCHLPHSDTAAYGSATAYTDHKSHSTPASRRRSQTNVRCFHYIIIVFDRYSATLQQMIQIELIWTMDGFLISNSLANRGTMSVLRRS